MRAREVLRLEHHDVVMRGRGRCSHCVDIIPSFSLVRVYLSSCDTIRPLLFSQMDGIGFVGCS